LISVLLMMASVQVLQVAKKLARPEEMILLIDQGGAAFVSPEGEKVRA
jgi:hypothetical protein